MTSPLFFLYMVLSAGMTQVEDYPPERSHALKLAASDTTPVEATVPSDLLSHLDRIAAIQIPILPATMPGGAANTPVAFGGSWGSGGVGFSYQPRARYSRGADGAIGGSVGLGDPLRAIGVDVGVVILDLRPDSAGHGGFGQRGAFSVKVHRRVSGSASVAVGVENALKWGGGSDTPHSFYGVVSGRVRLKEKSYLPFSRLHVSAGVGSGRYLPEERVFSDGLNLGLFANSSIQVIESASLLVEWTGQNISAGASLAPFPSVPFAMTVSLADLTSASGDGPRLVLGGGWGFRW